MKLIFKYNFINKANVSLVDKATLVPIYQSSISARKLQDFSRSYVPFYEYFQLVPFFIERSLFNHTKHFVVDMSYSKEANLINLQLLSHAGIYSKLVSPSNIIPVTYGDYKLNCSQNLFASTTRIDYEMIYFNTLQTEFYVFDSEGKWNDVEIPQLSIDKLFDEKKYLNSQF